MNEYIRNKIKEHLNALPPVTINGVPKFTKKDIRFRVDFWTFQNLVCKRKKAGTSKGSGS